MVQDDWLTTPAPGEVLIPPLPAIHRWTPDRAGIIIDGDYWKTHSQTMLLIKEAEDSGWVPGPIEQQMITAVRGKLPGVGAVPWSEMLMDIVTWMNNNAAPDGYRFGWLGNLFMLMSEENWCKRTGEIPSEDGFLLGVPCDDAGHSHG